MSEDIEAQGGTVDVRAGGTEALTCTSVSKAMARRPWLPLYAERGLRMVRLHSHCGRKTQPAMRPIQLSVVVDNTTPTILSKAINQTAFRAGDALFLTDKQALASAPTLSVNGGADGLTMTLSDDVTYGWGAAIDGTTPSGTYSCSVNMVDAVGNSATDNAACDSFVVDSSVPVISDVSVVAGGFGSLDQTAHWYHHHGDL